MPSSPDAHYQLGLALLTDGQANSAAAQFRKALEINPENPKALNDLGVALVSLKDPEAVEGRGAQAESELCASSL